MPLFRWGSPLDAFRDLDRLLHSVEATFQSLRAGHKFPLVNIYDVDSEFLITAELPGTTVSDLDITFANGALTLRGTRHDHESIPGEHFRRSERMSGKWERSFTLPDRIREDEIHAEYKNGILKLHVPKAAPVLPKKIPVHDTSI